MTGACLVNGYVGQRRTAAGAEDPMSSINLSCDPRDTRCPAVRARDHLSGSKVPLSRAWTTARFERAAGPTNRADSRRPVATIRIGPSQCLESGSPSRSSRTIFSQGLCAHRPLALLFRSGLRAGVAAVALAAIPVAAWAQAAAPEGIDPHSPAAPAEARPSPLDTRRPAGSPNSAVVDFQRPLARIAFGARADPASWVAAADGEDARVPEPEDSVRGAAAAGAIGPREVASAEQAEATGAGDPRSLIQQRSSRSSTPRRKPPSRNFRAYLQSRCGSVCSRRSAGRCAQGHGARRSRRNT